MTNISRPPVGEDSSAPDISSRLLSLEVGRFVAALLVVLYHVSSDFLAIRHERIFGMAFRGGHAGVEYFFVLSGFILYHVHGHELGQSIKLKSFLIKRFVRLYPLYWLVFAVTLAASALCPHGTGGHVSTGLGLAQDLLMLPMSADLVVPQSWSLRHELVFYAVFALAIWNDRIGIRVLVGWLTLSLVVGLMNSGMPPQPFRPFVYLNNVGFGAGLLAAWAAQRWRPARPGLLAIVGMTGFFACLAMDWRIGQFLPPMTLALGPRISPVLYVGCATLIVLGLAQYEKARGAPPGGGVPKALGGSSYALYLIHMPLGPPLIRALRGLPDPVAFCIVVAVSVAVALAVHRWIERPLVAKLRDRLLPPGRRSSSRPFSG
jgi:exopolysaccharide production protein ExoZ